jgi:hypothetical protein
MFASLCRADHELAAIQKLRWRGLAQVRLIALRRGNGIREQIDRVVLPPN